MLITLFAASIVVLAVIFVLDSIAVFYWPVSNGEAGYANWLILLSIAFLALFTDFNARYHPWQYFTLFNIVVIPLIYLVLGVGWSWLKWKIFLKKTRNEAEQSISEFKKYYPQFVEGFSIQNREYQDYLLRNNSYWVKGTKNGYDKTDNRVTDFRPSVYEYKSKIVMWIAYWPYSVLHSLFADFLWNLGEVIYNYMSGIYNRMADKEFKDFQ